MAAVWRSALLHSCLVLGSHLAHQLHGVLEARGCLHICHRTHNANTLFAGCLGALAVRGALFSDALNADCRQYGFQGASLPRLADPHLDKCSNLGSIKLGDSSQKQIDMIYIAESAPLQQQHLHMHGAAQPRRQSWQQHQNA